MSPTSYQAALPRVIPSLLSATLIIIPYSNSFVKRVRKVFLQRKQRMKTRLLTFFEPLPVKRAMKKTSFFLPRAIVFLAFQNAPESFHRAVVNAVGYTRHALCHTRIFQHVVKSMTCVLKPTVAMEQRMCVRIVIFDININKVSVGAFHFIKEAVALKSAVFYGKKITLIYLALGCSFFVRDCLNSRTFAVNIARIEQAVSMAP